MKYLFHIDHSRNVVFQKFSGKVTVKDIRNAISNSIEKPDWPKNHDILSDFCEAQLDISYEEMEALARWHPKKDRIRKIALVVSGDLGFGLCKMYKCVSQNQGTWVELGVFRDLAEAKEWLQIIDDVLPQVDWLAR